MVRATLAPITVKAALKQVKAWHRHLPDLQGGLFAVQVVDEAARCIGVGVVGNPARAWQGTARAIISRVATEGHENACSQIYGALARAAKALGYSEVWTYTLPGEPGTSLRARNLTTCWSKSPLIGRSAEATRSSRPART